MASERMREHGILFSAPMVRTILDGRKTQTRRVVKPQPSHDQVHEWKGKVVHDGTYRQWCWKGNVFPPFPETIVDCYGTDTLAPKLVEFAPHGPVGRRLWVRETWALYRVQTQEGEEWDVVYRADGKSTPDRWHPAIHMSRCNSRITLEVTGVRVERVQSITEEDARAEGMDWAAPYMGKVDRRRRQDDDREDPREVGYGEGSFARQNYATLWDEINGAGSWASNPWVWVYEFRRIGHGE